MEPWPGVNVTGRYCQDMCDNTACERGGPPHRRLCSGHGECVCGRCECAPHFKGDDCGCREAPEECRSPDTPDRVCSGHGVCPCDK